MAQLLRQQRTCINHSNTEKMPNSDIETSSEAVHLGKDGWLFLLEGSNSVADLYREPSSFTDEHAQQWFELLSGRQQICMELGCEYVHLPAPEKLTVLHRYFDGEIQNLAGSPIRQMSAKYGGNISCFINPIPYFETQSQDYLLYWKTDTHWSFWGCYSAYQLLCSHLGIPHNTDIVNYPYQEGKVVFDLASKLSEPYPETARFYDICQNAKRISANNLVNFKESNNLYNEISLHVGSSVIYKNTDKDAIQKKVILFGDSFSEYRAHLLTGMLAETFQEVHFIWNASLDYDYIKREEPDLVVSQLAERFMTRVPVDDLNLDEFCTQRIAQYRPNVA